MAETQQLQVQKKREQEKREESTIPARVFVPTADIYETQDALTVILEMPGVEKSNVNVRVEEASPEFAHDGGDRGRAGQERGEQAGTLLVILEGSGSPQNRTGHPSRPAPMLLRFVEHSKLPVGGKF
jgi:hypothetical protein